MKPITLTASQLAGLLKPVIPHACPDDMIPVINAVLIESDGRWLYAMATDRFTMGIQRIEKRATDDDPTTEWPEFRALIPLRSVKALLALFKPSRRATFADVSLSVDGDKLIAEGAGGFDMFDASRFTYHLESAQYPDMRKMLAGATSEAKERPLSDIDFNPTMLARFSLLSNVRMTFGIKGAVVTNDHGFIGAIMPRRATEDREDWTNFLAPKPEPKKAPAKRASKKAVA